MANAILYIRFTANPTTADGNICLYLLKNGEPLSWISEHPATIRYYPFMFAIGETAYRSLDNYTDALLADSSGVLIGKFTARIVTREDNLPWLKIEGTSTDISFSTTDIPSYAEIEIINPEPPTPVFLITDHTFSQADSDKNNKVKVTFTVENETGTPAYYVAGESISAVANGFDINRQSISAANRVAYGIDEKPEQSNNYVIPAVRKYSITAEMIVTLSGATINIVRNVIGAGAEASPFQYSLDGINYVASSTFYGILAGSYTAYMTDGYGGLYTYAFEVPELLDVKPEPYFNIEKANPLRFVNQAIPAFRNFANTLFNDVTTPNLEKRYFRQPFLLTDVVKTQIKTNYDNISIDVIDCNGATIETITPDLEIKNVGLKDKRDCYIKTGGEGLTNICFFQGNIYDPVTSAIIDTYLEGSGRLPSFCQAGMLINITGTNINGIFEVISIVYDDEVGAWACVIEGDFPFTAENSIALSIYNAETYNIYEFSLIITTAGQYHLIATATDDYTGYTTQVWKSEPVFFNTHADTVNIRYYSEDNQAKIDYRTGVAFDLCIPARLTWGTPAGEDEIFQDDSGNSQLQKSVYIATAELETGLIPAWLAEKIFIATGHPTIEVQGIEVVRPEKPEVTFFKDENNPFVSLKVIFYEKEDVSISESVGIVSAQAYALGVSENEVLGI